ncbi:hypothetical protein F4819DRAFT_359960 [Hypoxylon fuscum]|nr:hypothetical protein F4819DRAFT_359960 [Hypoxylon fuscum]
MTIEQMKRRAGQPSDAKMPSSSSSCRPSTSSGSKTSTPAQSRNPTTMATTKLGQSWNRSTCHTYSAPGRQQHGRPLEAAAILNNPRLQQVTGLHPRKASWWNGMQPPRDELARLQWVMSLPDLYPVKRPRGNF